MMKRLMMIGLAVMLVVASTLIGTVSVSATPKAFAVACYWERDGVEGYDCQDESQYQFTGQQYHTATVGVDDDGYWFYGYLYFYCEQNVVIEYSSRAGIARIHAVQGATFSSGRAWSPNSPENFDFSGSGGGCSAIYYSSYSGTGTPPWDQD